MCKAGQSKGCLGSWYKGKDVIRVEVGSVCVDLFLDQ